MSWLGRLLGRVSGQGEVVPEVSSVRRRNMYAEGVDGDGAAVSEIPQWDQMVPLDADAGIPGADERADLVRAEVLRIHLAGSLEDSMPDLVDRFVDGLTKEWLSQIVQDHSSRVGVLDRVQGQGEEHRLKLSLQVGKLREELRLERALFNQAAADLGHQARDVKDQGLAVPLATVMKHAQPTHDSDSERAEPEHDAGERGADEHAEPEPAPEPEHAPELEHDAGERGADERGADERGVWVVNGG